MTVLYVAGAFLGIIVAFVAWRWTSVARGARKRDERILPLLDPIAALLENGQPVAAADVETVASHPYARPLLYTMLEHYKRLDLFPGKYLDRTSHAEASLMYWLAHPNELQDYPEAMELVDTVSHTWSGGSARDDGWLLGVVGPYSESADGYASEASPFSRAGDKAGEVTPSELVAWYAKMLEKFRSGRSD
jgi:hypothetical protein